MPTRHMVSVSLDPLSTWSMNPRGAPGPQALIARSVCCTSQGSCGIWCAFVKFTLPQLLVVKMDISKGIWSHVSCLERGSWFLGKG